jgi:hypothetical protein
MFETRSKPSQTITAKVQQTRAMTGAIKPGSLMPHLAAMTVP